MDKHKRNDKKILFIILCVLVVIIIGLVTAIVVVDVLRKNGGEGGTLDGGAGGTSQDGDDQSGDTWQGDNIEQQEQKDEIQEIIREMPREDAIIYLDEKIEHNDEQDNDFVLRLTKVNVLYNGNDFEGALAEALKIENVESLSLQDQRQYYNIMRHIYLALGNEEEANRYGELWVKVYDELFDGGEAFYE